MESKYQQRFWSFVVSCIKTALFLGLCVFMTAFLSKITLPYDVHWYISRLSIGRIAELPENSIDVAAFGGSSTYHSIAAMEMYKEYGISAFTVANSNQPINTTYYMIDYFLSKQNPKVVLLDVGGMFGETNMDGTRRALDILPLNKQKLSWICDYTSLPDTGSFLSFLFPVVKFHENYKKIVQGVFKIEDTGGVKEWYHISNGLEMDPRQINKDYEGITILNDSRVPCSDFGIDYANRIINLCKEKDVELILCKYPDINWTIDYHNTIEDIAKEHELIFIDVNMPDALKAMDFIYALDIRDAVHANTFGAAKISRYIGKILDEVYNLPDRRGEDGYEFQEEELAAYEHIFAMQSLQFTREMNHYLKRLEDTAMSDSENYTVIFTIKDEGTSGLTKEIQEQFAVLGFETDFSDKYRHGFIGIWEKEKVIYEKLSPTRNNPVTDALVYTGELPGGVSLEIKSSGMEAGNISSILIDEVEYSQNKRGFNIVVFDNESGEVIDSVNWDTYSGTLDSAVR